MKRVDATELEEAAREYFLRVNAHLSEDFDDVSDPLRKALGLDETTRR